MPQGNPKAGEKYLHFKNKMYQVITLAHHSETDERLVVYQALYGDFGVCARPYDMFISEVDHEKYPEVKQKYRFTYIDSDNDQPYWATEKAESESAIPSDTEHPQAPIASAVEREEPFIKEEPFKKVDIVIRENLPREDRIVIKVDKSERIEHEPVKAVPPLKVSEKQTEEIPADGEEGQANPWLMKFLDAETFDEKYEVLGQMYRDIDDKLIDDIAVCMDVVVPEGNLQERFMQLKQCLRTRQKYEGTRL